MTGLLERTYACVPVCAVDFVQSQDVPVAIYALGNRVVLAHAHTGKQFGEIQVFHEQSVHGITHQQKADDDCNASILLCVWGGSSLRFLNLKLLLTESSASIQPSCEELKLEDWILDAAFQDSPDSQLLCVVTAHNDLVSIAVPKSHENDGKQPTSIKQEACGLRCILYAAHISWASLNHVLIAAGTAFGEIVVWSCDFDSGFVKTHRIFTGHEGSIYGIKLSPCLPQRDSFPERVLVSCSDDRTIRVWELPDDILNLDPVQQISSEDSLHPRTTGFIGDLHEQEAYNSEGCIARAWGHQSRIWGISFFSTASTSQGYLGLISSGEDATAQTWKLYCEKSTQGAEKYKGKLVHGSTHKCHSGKNIWSAVLANLPSEDNEALLLTGGADGAIMSMQFSGHHEPVLAPNMTSDSVHALFLGSEKQDPKTMSKKQLKQLDFVKVFAFVSESEFLTISNCGSMHLSKDCGGSFWPEHLATMDSYKSWSVITSDTMKGFAALGNGSGDIHCFDHSTKSIYQIVALNTRLGALFMVEPLRLSSHNDQYAAQFTLIANTMALRNARVHTIYRDATNAILSEDKGTLELPDPFIICSALSIPDENILVLGSREGSVAVYHLDNDAQNHRPILVTEYVHGRDAVTSMALLPKADNSVRPTSYIATCGRDGLFCINALSNAEDSAWETVHRSRPPIGTCIEGLHWHNATSSLLIWGFRRRCLVLWNETAQNEVLEILCEGPNVSWTFDPSAEEVGGSLLWTLNSNLHCCRRTGAFHRVVREGGHGREIKASAAFESLDIKFPSLLATGSEDTTIRIFAVMSAPDSQSKTGLKCLRILRRHTNGLQHLQWSEDGRYLFSSAGNEEFLVWRIQWIPGFGLGTLCLGSLHPEHFTSDLRITSFQAVYVQAEDGADRFLIGMVLADSAIKIYLFDSSRHRASAFTLLYHGQYGSSCLTQIGFVIHQSCFSCYTAATDGHITSWNIPTETHFSVSTDKLHLRSQTLGPEILGTEIKWSHHHQVHQSSIKSLTSIVLSRPTSHGDSVENEQLISDTLLITGGDDNALAFTRLQLHHQNASNTFRPSFSTLIIPSAHASAINAIASTIVASTQSTRTFTVFSSGNDQRVKKWNASINLSEKGVEGLQVELEEDCFTAVADVADMNCLRSKSDEDGVEREGGGAGMVVTVLGVGMESWEMR